MKENLTGLLQLPFAVLSGVAIALSFIVWYASNFSSQLERHSQAIHTMQTVERDLSQRLQALEIKFQIRRESTKKGK